MKPAPIVSVIIPAYNAETFITECLDTVFAQTLTDFEVIVVDDGSADDTVKVLESDPRNVRVFTQPNSGQGAARNRGFSEARGRYIALLDADDLWCPDFLRRTVDFLEEHSDAIAVSCAFQVTVEDQTVYPQVPSSEPRHNEMRILDDFFAFWAKYDHIRTGTCLIRKEAVDAVGGQLADLRISQDLEFWGILGAHGQWGIIPEVLWIGNSRRNAAKTGWWNRYAKRRRLCPTIAQWQRRILPKLKEDQLSDFAVIRGRVALNYVHSMILSGDFRKALDEFHETRQDIPVTKTSQLISKFERLGYPGWWTAGRILQLKERLKSLRVG